MKNAKTKLDKYKIESLFNKVNQNKKRRICKYRSFPIFDDLLH